MTDCLCSGLILLTVMTCVWGVPTSALAQAGSVDHTREIGKLPEADQVRFGALLSSAQTSFEQGDFVQATELLHQAQSLYPHPRILYKLAQSYERSGELQLAREHYQLYFESDDVEGDKVEVVGLIHNLDRRLKKPANLVLTSSPAGAFIYLDRSDEPIGVTPLLSYPLEPGDHVVRLSLDEYEEFTFELKAKPGGELVLDKRLVAQGAHSLMNPVEPTSPGLARPIGIMSAVLGVGSGVLFLVARQQAAALDESYATRRSASRPNDLDVMTSRHNGLVISAWTLGALSIVGSSWSIMRWRRARAQTVLLDTNAQGTQLIMKVTF